MTENMRRYIDRLAAHTDTDDGWEPWGDSPTQLVVYCSRLGIVWTARLVEGAFVTVSIEDHMVQVTGPDLSPEPFPAVYPAEGEE